MRPPPTTTGGTTVVPQPGAINPATNRNNRTVDNARATEPTLNATSVSLAEKQEKENEIYTELKYLVFLAYNDTQSDYLNANLCAVFPKEFKHLGEIIVVMDKFVQKSLTGEFQSSGTGGSGFAFSESAIIYGITDWAIKNAKEQLINVYLDAWYQKLKKDNLISPLIPQSLKVYDAFKADEAINLAKYGDKWKAAFQEDLRNIPIVFQDVNYVGAILTKVGLVSGDRLYEELKPLIAGGDELVYNLYLKKHAVTVLSGMAAKYNQDTEASFAVFKRCVIMGDLLARVCGRMDETKNAYKPVSIQAIKEMTLPAWKLLFKLMILRDCTSLKHVFDDNAPTFLANIAFTNANTNVGQIARLVEESITIIAAYQNLLSSVKATGINSELSFDDVRKMFDLLVQLADNVSGYLALSTNGQKLVTEYRTNVKPFLGYLAEVGEGISTRQYGKVLDGAVSILKKVDDLKDPNKEDMAKTIEYIQRYGSFMLNILTAREAGEVQTALDELIPKGQYQLKNQKNFTVSLSVFPGAFGGVETVKKYQVDNNGDPVTSLPKKTSSKGSISFFLPIGVDFNFGRETKKSSIDK